MTLWKSFVSFLSKLGDLILGLFFLWNSSSQFGRVKVGPVLETGTPPSLGSLRFPIASCVGQLFPRKRIPRKRKQKKSHHVRHKEKNLPVQLVTATRTHLATLPPPVGGPLILRNCNLQRTTLEFSTLKFENFFSSSLKISSSKNTTERDAQLAVPRNSSRFLSRNILQVHCTFTKSNHGTRRKIQFTQTVK